MHLADKCDHCSGQINVTTPQWHYKIRGGKKSLKVCLFFFFPPTLCVIFKSIGSPYLNFSYLEIIAAKCPLKFNIIRDHGFESFLMSEHKEFDFVFICVFFFFSVVSPDGFNKVRFQFGKVQMTGKSISGHFYTEYYCLQNRKQKFSSGNQAVFCFTVILYGSSLYKELSCRSSTSPRVQPITA